MNMKSRTTPPSADALGHLGRKAIRNALKQIFGGTLVNQFLTSASMTQLKQVTVKFLMS